MADCRKRPAGLGTLCLLVLILPAPAAGQRSFGAVAGTACFEVESRYEPFQLASPVEIALYQIRGSPLLLPGQPNKGIMLPGFDPVLEHFASATVTEEGDLFVFLPSVETPSLRYPVRLGVKGDSLVGSFDGVSEERVEEFGVIARRITCPVG